VRVCAHAQALLINMAAYGLLLNPLAPSQTRQPYLHAAPVAMQEQPSMPEASELADAWRREDKAKELVETLKGCSIYVVGLGGRKSAVSRVLARRLRYRCYDVSALMCSTYAAMSGGDGTLSLPQLIAKEPLADVEQLAGAVLTEVQQFTRSVFVAWDGAVGQSAFAVMQQGIIVNLEFDATTDDDIALPASDAEETKASWVEGHAKADLTVKAAQGSAADDVASEVVDALIKHIAANPAKSTEWKAEADAKLKETDGD
jgi:hypothetical protein